MTPKPIGSFGEAFEGELRTLLARFDKISVPAPHEDWGEERFRFRITAKAADDPEFLTLLIKLLLSWSGDFANALDRQATLIRKLEADRR